MKKLFIAALLMIGMTSFAQEGKPMRVAEPMIVEQRNELQLKNLTAELKLDANQQQEMLRILNDRSTKKEEMRKEMATKKATGVKPTDEERNSRKNVIVDYENAEKAKLQKLLTPDQFAKYEKMKKERDEKMKANQAKSPQMEKK